MTVFIFIVVKHHEKVTFYTVFCEVEMSTFRDKKIMKGMKWEQTTSNYLTYTYYTYTRYPFFNVRQHPSLITLLSGN